MNNQREPSNASDISQINNNINNIYYTLNIISNSLLMSQSQTMMNELRRNDRNRLLRESLFRPTQSPNNTTSIPPLFSMPSMYPDLPYPLTRTTNSSAGARAAPTPGTGVRPTQTQTPTPGTGVRPTQTQTPTPGAGVGTATPGVGATPTRDSLSNLFRNIFRNEIPTSIGNMEISVLGLNTNDSTSDDSEHIVVSHHNIFSNTKIKTKVYENDSDDENETNVDTLERCTICLCDIENNSIIREINKCKHIFHVECADRWFQDNIKCPHCRQDIRGEIVD